MNERKDERKSPKKGRQTAEAIERAGMRIKRRDRMENVDVYEAEPEGCPDRAVVVFDAEEGMHVGVRLELPAGSDLRGAPVLSDRALLVQGILSVGLQHHHLQVEPLAHAEGLEGFLLTFHLCDHDRDLLRERHARVDAVAHELSEAFAHPGEDLAALKAVVGFRAFAPELAPARAQAAIVPTFDLEARDRMMREASRT